MDNIYAYGVGIPGVEFHCVPRNIIVLLFQWLQLWLQLSIVNLEDAY